MNYKKQLKKRIKEVEPAAKIGKIRLSGCSFRVVIKNTDIDIRRLEHELRETLSMPGLVLVSRGE